MHCSSTPSTRPPPSRLLSSSSKRAKYAHIYSAPKCKQYKWTLFTSHTIRIDFLISCVNILLVSPSSSSTHDDDDKRKSKGKKEKKKKEKETHNLQISTRDLFVHSVCKSTQHSVITSFTSERKKKKAKFHLLQNECAENAPRSTSLVDTQSTGAHDRFTVFERNPVARAHRNFGAIVIVIMWIHINSKQLWARRHRVDVDAVFGAPECAPNK